MANHGVVRTDLMHGTTFPGALVSVRYAPSNVKTAIDNGNFVVFGNYETGEREVRVGTTPAANTPLNKLCLIASEEVDKTVKADLLVNFENVAGAICRGYKLFPGDFFALTADCFTKASAVTATVNTSILEAQASTKGALVNSLTAGSTKIATLRAIEVDGPVTWYVFEIADPYDDLAAAVAALGD